MIERAHEPFVAARARDAAAALIAVACVVTRAASQPAAAAPPTVHTTLEATAGSEMEFYLRALALVGAARDPGVTLRGHAPRELAALGQATAHPWAGRIRRAGRCRAEVAALPVSARARWNSRFPFAMNDGPVWEGRGATYVASAGVAACAGPVTFVMQPVAYDARNRPYALTPLTVTAPNPYVDPLRGNAIDLPQRFGDRPYRRLDPGQSTLRVDVGPVAGGVSTATQVWGPAAVHPLLLGSNAAGFRHVFVGTSGMQSIGVARAGARLILGRTVDSPYAPEGSRPRSIAGGVFVVSPNVAPGLEVGTGRVFHRRVPASGLAVADLFTVFESYFQTAAAMRRKNDPDSPDYTPDNQLASVFAAWTFPRAGFRVYGELLKNDNNLNVRELITEPDHASAYLLGFERGVRSADGRRLVVVRAELVNSRVTHLERVREQAGAYAHSPIVQGHTNRGEVLGSVGVLGGGAQHLGVDHYTARQRLSFVADRVVRQQPPGEGAPSRLFDVQHAVGASGARFFGPLELAASVRYVRELNRNFVGDETNWQLGAGVIYRPPWFAAVRRER